MHKHTLSQCPSTPNCVSSIETGSSHYIAPLRYQGSEKQAREKLLNVIHGLRRSCIVEDSGHYIKTTFTSLLFRFVDDVEFLIDAQNKRIHMRSASRVGYYDLGVNRKRCEKIRSRFNQ